MSKKVRIGIILDNPVLVYPYDEILNKLSNNENIELVIAIINNNEEKKKSSLFDGLFFRLLRLFERKIFFKGNKKSFPIEDFFPKVLSIKPIISKSGFVYRYYDEDIQKILEENIDLIIRGNSGILRGGILNKASKYGVISLHHGDNRFYRGGPPGFWEVFNNESKTGFIVQILNESLDNGKVLYLGHIKTKRSFIQNQQSVYSASINPFIEYIENIKKYSLTNNKLDIPVYTSRLYINPTSFETFIYTTKLLRAFSTSIYRKTFSLDWLWDSYYLVDYKNELRNALKLPQSKKRFIADPYSFSNKKGRFIFVEELPYNTRKGIISLYDIDKDKYYSGILEESFHLSFPRIFSLNGIEYLTVESLENKDLRIYETNNFPFEWKLAKTFFTGHCILDPLTFKFNNEVYIHINHSTNGEVVTTSTIYRIISNDSGIELEELTYQNNSAQEYRNGGVVYHNNTVYRVVQCDKDEVYGHHIKLYKIVIKNNKYFEFEDNEYFNNPYYNTKCFHTLNIEKGITVFDTARLVRIFK